MRNDESSSPEGFDRFEIIGKLGTGGMGSVYAAYDRARGMRVALKMLHKLDASRLYLFKREFRAIRGFSHPNLVRLYELLYLNQCWFVSMELIQGVRFMDRIRGPKSLAEDFAKVVATRPSYPPEPSPRATGSQPRTAPSSPDVEGTESSLEALSSIDSGGAQSQPDDYYSGQTHDPSTHDVGTESSVESMESISSGEPQLEVPDVYDGTDTGLLATQPPAESLLVSESYQQQDLSDVDTAFLAARPPTLPALTIAARAQSQPDPSDPDIALSVAQSVLHPSDDLDSAGPRPDPSDPYTAAQCTQSSAQPLDSIDLELLQPDQGTAALSSRSSYSSADRKPTKGEQARTRARVSLPTPAANRPAFADLNIIGPDHLVDYFRQLANALSVLHSADVVHRDLKPSNVMITNDDDRVVLLDFGIIAELSQSRGRREKMIVGTPLFMAPEQFRGQVTKAVDSYAYGTMLYVALTGYMPYEGALLELAAAKVALDPLPPSALAHGVPAPLEELCLRCLSRDPDARPTAAQILDFFGKSPTGHVPAAERSGVEPFVGRERELGALRAAYQHALSGGETVCVIVKGPSGMGKSMLINRFLGEIRHGVVLTGRSHAQEEIPFKAFDEIIDELVNELVARTEAERNALLPEGFHALVQLFPTLGAVKPATAPTPGMAPSPKDMLRVAGAALRDLMGSLAGQKPLVIYSEDLQWTDQDSLDFLLELMRPPTPASVLFILTVRAESLTDAGESPELLAALDSLKKQVTCRTIDIGPFGPADQQELLTRLGKNTKITGSGRSSILAEAAGHPMLLSELARMTDTAHGWLSDKQELRLDDILWYRVGRLEKTERELLHLIVIAGVPIPEHVLAAAANLEMSQVSQLLVSLNRASLARTSWLNHQQWVDVYHDRIREVIAERCSPVRAQALHRLVADALVSWDKAPDALIARHWQAAGENQRAATYLLRAAERASAQYAIARAMGFYADVLELMPEPCPTPEDAHLRCDALIGMAKTVRSFYRLEEALDALDRATLVARAHRLLDTLANIEYMRGNLYYVLGDSNACWVAHHKARDIARQIDSPSLEARALSGIADAYMMQARGLSARHYYEQCVDVCRKHDLIDFMPVNLAIYAVQCYFGNEPGLAEKCLLEAIEASVHLGELRSEIVSRTSLTWVYTEMGRYQDAHALAKRAYELAKRSGSPRMLVFAAYSLAKTEAFLGRPDVGLALANKLLDICRTHNHVMDYPFAYGALVQVTQDDELRRRLIKEAELSLHDTASVPNMLYRRDAIEASLALGEWDEIDHQASALEEYLSAEPLPWSQLLIRWARALAAYGRCYGTEQGQALRPPIQQLLHEAISYNHSRTAELLIKALETAPPWRL